MADASKRSRDSEPTFSGSSAMIEKKTNEDSLAKKVKKDNSFILHTSMAELYSQREFSDITIQIGERQFQSNRLFLASLSEYFYEMFGGDSGDFRNPTETIIFMDDLDVNAFELIINFMNKGDVDEITNDNVIGLMETANFLRLRNSYIETKCTEYLEKKSGTFRIMNAIELFKRFRILSYGRSIANFVREHICLHLEEFRNNDTLGCISYEELKELLPPGCPFWKYNQDCALNFLVGWVHHNRKERKQYFKELIKIIDVGKLSKHWISFLLTEWEKSLDEFEVSEGSNNCPSLGSSLPRCPIGVFTFLVKNFSKMGPWNSRLSPLYEYKLEDKFFSFLWQIHVQTHSFDGYLFFGLETMTVSSSVDDPKCSVKLKFSILAQDEGRDDLTQDLRHEFSETNIMAQTPFARWSEVVDPNRGLMKDDTVIFQVKMLGDC